MADPINLNPVQQVQQIDTTSDVAGGAAVTPAYIASEVAGVAPVEPSVGIDSVSVSMNVSSPTAAAPSSQPILEVPGYIVSDTGPNVSDLIQTPVEMDMNSIDKIDNSYQYITPDDQNIQVLLMSLKNFGIINSSMSFDDLALAINSYVTSNFSYQSDKVGDVWNSISQTIAIRGGDCEDLANLEVSLLTAALMDRGLSEADASNRVGAVVVGNTATTVGHVLVSYVCDNGMTQYMDPSNKDYTGFVDLTRNDLVLFKYNSEGSMVLDLAYNYATFMTASGDTSLYDVSADTRGYEVPSSSPIAEIVPNQALTDAQNALESARSDMYRQLFFFEDYQNNDLDPSVSLSGIASTSAVVSADLQAFISQADSLLPADASQFPPEIQDAVTNYNLVLDQFKTNVASLDLDTSPLDDINSQISALYTKLNSDVQYRQDNILDTSMDFTTLDTQIKGELDAYNEKVGELETRLEQMESALSGISFDGLNAAYATIQTSLNDYIAQISASPIVITTDAATRTQNISDLLNYVDQMSSINYPCPTVQEGYGDETWDMPQPDALYNAATSYNNDLNQLKNIARGVFGNPISIDNIQTQRLNDLLSALQQDYANVCTAADSTPSLAQYSTLDAKLSSIGLGDADNLFYKFNLSFADESQDPPVIGNGDMPNLDIILSGMQQLPLIRASLDSYSSNLTSFESSNILTPMYYSLFNAKLEEFKAYTGLLKYDPTVDPAIMQGVSSSYNDTVSALQNLMNSYGQDLINSGKIMNFSVSSTSGMSVSGYSNGGQWWNPSAYWNSTADGQNIAKLNNILTELTTSKGNLDNYTASVATYQTKYSAYVAALGSAPTQLVDTDKFLLDNLSTQEANVNDMISDLGNILSGQEILDAQAAVLLAQSNLSGDVGAINRTANHYYNDQTAGTYNYQCFLLDGTENKAAFGGTGWMSKEDAESCESAMTDYRSALDAGFADFQTYINSLIDYAKALYSSGLITLDQFNSEKTNLLNNYLNPELSNHSSVTSFSNIFDRRSSDPNSSGYHTYGQDDSNALETDIGTKLQGVLNTLDGAGSAYQAPPIFYFANGWQFTALAQTVYTVPPVTQAAMDGIVNSNASYGRVKDYFLIKQGDYYTINTGAIMEKVNELSDIKATLSIFSIIYEARRDLRGLVNQELTGEEGSYKGMDIPKLFEQKVDRANKAVQQVIENVMQLMNLVNNTIYQNKVNRENADRDEDAQKYEAARPGFFAFWNADWYNNQTDVNKDDNEVKRNQDLSATTSDFLKVQQQNKQAIKGMLATFAVQSGNSAILKATGNMDSLIVNADGSPIDKDTVVTLGSNGQATGTYVTLSGDEVNRRADIVGAVAVERVAAEAAVTRSQMRNLANQELTGIGGRSRRGDIISAEIESEGSDVLNMFDEEVHSISEVARLNNVKTQYDAEAAKNKELSDKDKEAGLKVLGEILTVLAAIAAVVAAVLAIIGTAGAGALALGALIGGLVGQLSAGGGALKQASDRKDIEKNYQNSTVIDLSGESSHVQLSDNAPVDTGNGVYDLVDSAENKIAGDVNSMTYENYSVENGNQFKSDLGDDYSWGSTVSFDSLKMAATQLEISGMETLITVANTIREAQANMRNLAHQEMTGIGGRAPSNMTTYAMEAARGQMAFIGDVQTRVIQDRVQTQNQKVQEKKNLAMLQHAEDGAAWGLIPIVGSVPNKFIQLYSQRQGAGSDAFSTFKSTAELDNKILSELVDNGVKVEGQNSELNYSAVVDARKAILKEFTINEVLISISSAQKSMRNLVHEEMTGVGGYEENSSISQANSVNFEGMMKALDLTTQYLQEKVDIANKAAQATKDYNSLTDKITAAWIMLPLEVGLTVAACFIPGLGQLGAQAVIGVIEGVFGALEAISNTINSWQDYAATLLNIDTGAATQAETIFNDLKAAIKNDANSSGTRADSLENQIADEMTEALISTIGNGKVGVNTGISAKYKDLLQKAYRGATVEAKLTKAIGDLRNLVHETMTGIGGASSNSALAALGMAQNAALAQIDTMMAALNQIADAKNKITDAQIASTKALASALRSTVMTAIQVAMTAYSVKCTVSMGALKVKMGNIEFTQTQIKGLETALKAAQASKDAGAIARIQEQLNSAQKALAGMGGADKLDDLTKEFNNIEKVKSKVQDISQIIQITANVVMTEIGRNMVNKTYGQVETKAQTDAEKSGSKNVIAARQQTGAMDFESLIAEVQTQGGKSDLEAKASKADTQRKTDMNEFKQDWSSTGKDVWDLGTGFVQSKIQERLDSVIVAGRDLDKMKPTDDVSQTTKASFKKANFNKEMSKALSDALPSILKNADYQAMSGADKISVLSRLNAAAEKSPKTDGIKLSESTINRAIGDVKANRALINQEKQLKDALSDVESALSNASKINASTIDVNVQALAQAVKEIRENLPAAARNTAAMEKLMQERTNPTQNTSKTQKSAPTPDLNKEISEAKDKAGNPITKEDLEQALLQAQDRLINAQKAIIKGMTALKDAKEQLKLQKGDVKALQGAIQSKFDELRKEYDKVSDQIAKYEEIYKQSEDKPDKKLAGAENKILKNEINLSGTEDNLVKAFK